MTSADVYTYLITLSIVVVSIFACWTLYYCIRILKRMYSMLDAIDASLHHWSDGWKALLLKFSSMRDTLRLIAQGLQTAQGVYRSYSKKKKSSHVKTSSDNNEIK